MFFWVLGIYLGLLGLNCREVVFDLFGGVFIEFGFVWGIVLGVLWVFFVVRVV